MCNKIIPFRAALLKNIKNIQAKRLNCHMSAVTYKQTFFLFTHNFFLVSIYWEAHTYSHSFPFFFSSNLRVCILFNYNKWFETFCLLLSIASTSLHTFHLSLLAACCWFFFYFLLIILRTYILFLLWF